MVNIGFIRPSKKGYDTWIRGNSCYRCNYEWKSKTSCTNEPLVCPNCKSSYWNKPRRDEKGKVENQIKVEEAVIEMHKVFGKLVDTKYNTIVSWAKDLDGGLYEAINNYHDLKMKQQSQEQEKISEESYAKVEKIAHIFDKEEKEIDSDLVKQVLKALDS